MAGVEDSLNAAMGISGAIAVALVDLSNGMTLASAGGGDGFNVEVAAAAMTDVLRAEQNALHALGMKTGIEDALWTLGDQFHVLRIMTVAGIPVFLFIALDRSRANLAMARIKAAEIASNLSF